jgi:uncharacterized protein (TIGR02118 family)
VGEGAGGPPVAGLFLRVIANEAPQSRAGKHRLHRQDGARMIKSISLLTRRPELSHDEFVRHWLDVHAPLAHAVPGVRRYVQNHIRDERHRADIPTTEVAVDGVAELWFDDRAAMDRANASPAAKRLHDDGALFIGSIKTFIVEEQVIIPISE